MQVLGIDLWNGTPTQTLSYKDATGATYPVLFAGSSSTGGNVTSLYGQGGGTTYDNFVVVDMSDRTVAYHAMLLWPHSNRYHLDEIRNTVDEILSRVVSVGEGSDRPGRALHLAATPNPFRGVLQIDLENPGEPTVAGRVTLVDLRGREVAVIHEGVLSTGSNRFQWGVAQAEKRLPAGVYSLLARFGERRVHKPVVYLP